MNLIGSTGETKRRKFGTPGESFDFARSFALSEDPQLLAGGRKDLTSVRSHHDCVLNADSPKPFQIDPRLDGDRHARCQAALVAAADPRRFMNLQAQAMTG